ncbi:hypothetical protein TSAR_009623 [Trichomalopsis sarcophagae]|uniref:Uncharacterized protein n=1 Tax=Trichomalopsis sarcophagae TaxID=543379 RepID=A0A232EN52_9HYME|nr:hypothetical protein TSAR_009623 [Trichomalopsis sarcophagae]
MSLGLEQRVGETPGSLDDADDRRYLVEGEVALGRVLLPSLTSPAASFIAGRLILVIFLLRRRLIFLLAFFAARVDLRVLIHTVFRLSFFISYRGAVVGFYFIFFSQFVLVWAIVCYILIISETCA